MLNKYKALSLAVSTLLGMGASQAAVTATFNQVGNDVLMTWSGSYNVPTPDDLFIGAAGADGIAVLGKETTHIYLSGIVQEDTTVAIVTGGEIFPYAGMASLTVGTYIGNSFGFDLGGENIQTEGVLILPKDFAGNTIFSPVGTMTFANLTIAQIFSNPLPTNQLVYRGAGSVDGDREIYITAIPEPSSALMLGFFATAALFTRKRIAR